MSKEIFSSINSILSDLPKKIINNRNHDALASCILYEISKDICLHLENAAYFIYNPDFHLCKGIAGIKKIEINDLINDPWSDIAQFQNVIQNTNYHKSIQSSQFCTLFSKKDLNIIINEIKKAIGAENEYFFYWQLPNNNIGILVYKSNQKKYDSDEKEYIENATSLLGFCPIP